jgi:hypothetical protein
MNKTMLAVALGGALWVWAGFSPASAEPLRRVRIEHAEAAALAEQLTGAGFDVLAGETTEESCEVIVSGAELEILEGQGFGPQVIDVGRPLREIQERGISVLAVPSGYQDWAGILTRMEAVQAEFPSLCQVVDLTEAYGMPPTFEGRHIVALRISDHISEEEDEPTCLLVGAHHAREIVTPVIALHVAEQLTRQYGSDPNVTTLVDEHEIWIAPVWNPDGYEHVFYRDSFWRKNRRVFASGVGVDLNRNYPVGWDSACSGTTNVGSQTYRGPAPNSEPETQTMMALAHDRHFAKVADLHSYAREVRYGYGCWYYPFSSFLASEASVLAAAADYRTRPSCCTGGDIHFHMATHGSHAFLWETHTTFQPGFASAQAEAIRVLPSLTALLERPIPVAGHVVDAYTGHPIVATITPVKTTFENGETNGSEGRWGRYHAFLPPGIHTLEFAAAGYFSQYCTVEVAPDRGQVVDIPMVPVVGDANGDGWTDMVDFAAVATQWRQTDCNDCGDTDTTSDHTVDFRDLQILADHWLRPPSPCVLTAAVLGDGGAVAPVGGVFERGTILTLRATPNPGYRLKSWNGTDDDRSTELINTVTMDSDETVTVEYEPDI